MRPSSTYLTCHQAPSHNLNRRIGPLGVQIFHPEHTTTGALGWYWAVDCRNKTHVTPDILITIAPKWPSMSQEEI